MAFITLAGTLRDPTSELAVGDQIRFTHKSTTGETVEGAVSVLTIDPSGTYSKDLQYGLVLVEYKDVRTSQFKNLGVATVNGSNPATSIPELLNALVPVSSAELIEFQAILADTVTARNEAEAFANSIDLINDLSQAYIFDTVAAFKASLIEFPDGKIIHLLDRGVDFIVISGLVTPNEMDIIYNTNTGKNIEIILTASRSFTPEAFGAIPVGYDNQPVFQRMMDVQVDYSFGVTTVKYLFDIELISMYEVHDTVYLSPFIVIDGKASHVQTLTDIGVGFNAIGDFTNKAIIDTAPFNIDGLRKPLLYASAGDLFDFGNYTTCGNVTLKNFIVKSDDQYNVTNCAFEAVHLGGSNGSIVRNVFGQNTIQGMSVAGGWQQEVAHNKFEYYWVGGLFWSNTTGFAQQNYFARDVAQRATVWADVSARPFFVEIATGGASYKLREKNFGLINIKSGITFDSNLVEACEYGFGISYLPNDWTPAFINTYMEKVTIYGYVIQASTTFEILLGKSAVVANLLDVEIKANGSNNNYINVISNQGTELVQGAISLVGTVDAVGSESWVNLRGFEDGSRDSIANLYYDRETVTSIKLQGDGSQGGIENLKTYALADVVGTFENGSLVPIASRTVAENPGGIYPAAGISVSTSSLLGVDNRGSYQILNKGLYGVSLRVLQTGGTWTAWREIQTSINGTTGQRENILLEVGQMFFDTTLGIPIWYNGASWVDASGVVV